MNIEISIWYFFIYASIGYLIEVVYCSLGERKLVNRGFLHGPYLPIYGFGAFFIVALFGESEHTPFVIFLISVLITSAVEYVSSYLLEILFHTRLWDYSNYRFHLRGRICLLNSILFGLLGLALIFLIHPLVAFAVFRLPKKVLMYGAVLFLVLIAIDTIVSVYRLSAFQKQLSEFKQRMQNWEHRLTLISSLTPSKKVSQLKELIGLEIEEFKLRLDSSAKRFLAVFPSMSSKDSEKQRLLNQLRQRARQRREKLTKRLHKTKKD